MNYQKTFSVQSIKTYIRDANKDETTRVVCNTYATAICATAVFLRLLEKRLIKYELSFTQMPRHVDFVANGTALLNGQQCECCSRIDGCYVCFQAAKALNAVETKTMLPLAIITDFYVKSDIGGDFCEFCAQAEADLSN